MKRSALIAVILAVTVLGMAGRRIPVSTAQTSLDSAVITKLSAARLATAKYATDLARAKADGYTIITQMIPNMGYHFLNPKVEGLDITKPAILVYVRKAVFRTVTRPLAGVRDFEQDLKHPTENQEGDLWQLVAIEWVFTQKPAVDPINGAAYGSFGAACHYGDGSFIAAYAEATCAKKHPTTGASFAFWHPPLVTLHLWIWYPNPNGVFGEFNPLLTPFNND